MTKVDGIRSTRSITLDTGALVAFDRGSSRMRALVEIARERNAVFVVPTCVVSQAWRNGATQAMLARLLKSEVVRFEGLDVPTAKAVGELCGRRGSKDIVDALVVITARRNGEAVVTSDPDDLLRLDPGLTVISPD